MTADIIQFYEPQKYHVKGSEKHSSGLIASLKNYSTTSKLQLTRTRLISIMVCEERTV